VPIFLSGFMGVSMVRNYQSGWFYYSGSRWLYENRSLIFIRIDIGTCFEGGGWEQMGSGLANGCDGGLETCFLIRAANGAR